jgi:ribonucleoside-diphosphate reductase alpha chain
VENLDRKDDTFCVNEPLEHKVVFNGILTGNCTEIFLHNKPTRLTELGDILEHGETYVCQLSSINGKYHVKDGQIDWPKLAVTTKTTVRAIDNAIDINFYPTHETLAHLKHRPIALGFMGFQDVCYALGIKYDSEEGVKLAGQIQEFVSYHATLASSELAKERGKYQTYDGSLWSKGIFPQDTYISLMEYRGQTAPKLSELETLDWAVVRNHVKEFGMRNSNTQAIAPTAGISYIHNCEQSIEPTYECLAVYENDAGTTYNINAFQWLKLELKKRGLWSSQIGPALLRSEVDGNIKYLDLPQDVKDLFSSCWDRNMGMLIDAAAARQIWIDQGQSMNVYYSGTVTKDISNLYKRAWEKGLKSTYYFRNKAASAIKKMEDSAPEYKEGAVCSMEEGCVVCQ